MNPALCSERADRHSIDWRALVIVVLAHIGLFVLFSSSAKRELEWPQMREMVVVELWDPSTATAETKSQKAALTTAAAQHVTTRARTQPAGHLRGMATRELAQKNVIDPAPQKTFSTFIHSDATMRSSSPHEESLASDGTHLSSAMAGNGSYTGPRFRPPRVQKRYKPDYPIDALRARKEGTTDVIVTVATDGVPTEAHVYQSSGDVSLDSAAVKATLAYSFKPAEKNGNPTAAQAIVTIDWRIGANTVEHYLVASPKESKDVERIHNCWIRGARNIACKNPGDRYHPHGDPEAPDYRQLND